ncbi:GNAT family N-acetyltransferase [Microbulbifer sp. MLAF003]|uniref:GNAT family N-acetyltransferase n=1 Tax=Microbulbifer sp. MLAF003 TaxID=3032582 RepID=UPI0024ACDEF3|nr:GNAT family N-acetyltransferase [Microbulbifer sp. MLAF003]WHI51075.1 GNAT family N-acetyltransferase [Microbulbifer sp. MLAF003]
MSELIQPATERLQLRQWREEDKPVFAEMNADPSVMEFFPSLLTREESDAGVDRSSAHIEKYGWGFWALELRESGEFLGFVGIKNVTDNLPFAPAVEIGWRLARPFWGKGYASEAARASLHVAFNTLCLNEVVSFTPLQNIRSQKVMERLGMQRDSLVFEHPQVSRESPLLRHCLYRLSASDWKKFDVIGFD